MEVIMTATDGNIESPAQGTEDDKLAELLRETAMHNDGFEKATPPHNRWDWYARYLSVRQHRSAIAAYLVDGGNHMRNLIGAYVWVVGALGSFGSSRACEACCGAPKVAWALC